MRTLPSLTASVLAAALVLVSLAPVQAAEPDAVDPVATATPAAVPSATPAATPTPTEEPTTTPEQPVPPVHEADAAATLETPPAARAEGAAEDGRTVISEGEVRIVSAIEDDRLVHYLLDESGARLDPATTVLRVPHAEPWPGDADGGDTWERIDPSHGDVYRTAGGGAETNPLSLVVDTSAVPEDAAFDPFGWLGPIYTRLGLAPGDPVAALLPGGVEFGGTTQRQAGQPWFRTTGGEGGLLPVSLAFLEPGRVCVPLATHFQRSDGAFLNADLTLTVAVGDAHAATIEPCAPPAEFPVYAPEPEQAAPGSTVIDAGVALLSTREDRDGIRLDVVTSDRGRAVAHDPADVVFSLPARDTQWPATGLSPSSPTFRDWERIAAPGATLWRSAGVYTPWAGSTLPNDLVLDLDASFMDWGQLSETSEGIEFTMTGASTTGDGYVATYRYSDSYGSLGGDGSGAAFWDSRPGGRTETQFVYPRDGEFHTNEKEFIGSPATGFAFSAAGVYCVGVRAGTTLAGASEATRAHATFTFAVGIDPAAVTPCTQQSDDDGPGQPTDPGGSEQLDPSVTWFLKNHLDLAPRLTPDGSLQIATGDGEGDELTPLRDAVWVGRGEFATFRVPEPDAIQDVSFIGVPGTTYYGFTQGSNYQNKTIWPGLSMLKLPVGYTDRDATWRVSKLEGPGDVVVWSGARHYLNSRTDTSSWFPVGRTHIHENWAFTAAGRYCLAIETRIHEETTGLDRSAQGLLTVVVGDVDLSQVQPCERTRPVEAPPAQPVGSVSAEQTVVSAASVAGNASTSGLELVERGGAVDVVAALRRPVGSGADYRDPEKTVLALARGGDTWSMSDRIATAIDAPGLTGDVTLHLGDVRGPGNYWLNAGRISDQFATALDTRAQRESREAILHPRYGFASSHTVDAAGVYCVPLTWSGTTAAGQTFHITKTLTLAAGVDAASVTPCAAGGEGSTPVDPGTPDPEPAVWDVPNRSLTASGATILTAGHVDIASRLDAGALATVVKDDTDGEPVYRDPARTVIQLRPEAQTSVPGAPAFGFLGAPGAALWQVTETQQDGLIWPGWSSELIDRGLVPAGIDWSLQRVDGPGEFTLYQSDLGVPRVLMSTRDGITAADTVRIAEHVHVHGTWAFSAEGLYCLGFERTAVHAGGRPLSSVFTLAIAVGRADVRAADPASCFTAAAGEPTEPDRHPIAEELLTPGSEGGVSVLDGRSGFLAGELVTVQVARERAGDWVSVWLWGAAGAAAEPRWLGWARVGSSGAVQVRLPADAAAHGHRLVVSTREGTLIGWDALTVVTAPPIGVPVPVPVGDTTPAVRQVAAAQCVAGATILSSGHIDYASRIVGGGLRSLVGDDSSGAKVYRDPADVVLWLKPSARQQLPAGYGAVGAAGQIVWQVPQTQNPNLIWVGWNTEALSGANAAGPVDWTLDAVAGPGRVTVYTSGVFGGVQSVVLDGAGSSYRIPLGVHAHANWAFSEQGVYRLRMTQTVSLPSGERSSDTATVTVAVGDIDPAQAVAGGSGCGAISAALLTADDEDAARRAAEQAAAEAAAAAAGSSGSAGTARIAGPDAPLEREEVAASPVPVLLGVLGGLLLVAGVGAGVVSVRRRRPAS
ncbi:MAG: TIGR03773 family transporter-associated surface protein [Microbacterium sp.]|uniref:TIGR03773 family transporter-associated surface protein n=1 Tax=Microbacterium sp. TaxID=51671 RepID=UPI001ACAA9AD|nr:TIGR03773 family transporter-associated surface protein [Microbacterium sp.]MBN9177985.1 TIGR03773 family transporter-associated surface protein [Microbacterium sp.]